MKKIILFLTLGIFFLVLFGKSSIVLANMAEPCKVCEGTTCTTIASGVNCTASLNECSTNYSCGAPTATTRPTAVPTTPCTPWCDYTCCSSYSCSGGTECAPTAVPTSSNCKNNGNACTTDGNCCSGYCNGFSGLCGVKPTAVPTSGGPTVPGGGATPVPTTVVCEGSTDGDNICNNGAGYCENTCDTKTHPEGGYVSRIRCYTSSSCPPTWCNNNVYSLANELYVGTVYCPAVGDPSPTSYCHPFQCFNAPNSVCPGFNPASTCASKGGKGNCDNCGGPNCGSCPGTVVATATPLPGGGTNSCNCSDYISIAANLCINQAFLCPGSNPEIYCYGLKGCNAPTLDSLILENGSGTEVSADSDGRNHICESTFVNDALPRRVIVKANVIDLDGYSNISTVQLRWNGNIYDMSFVSGSGTGAVYTTTIDFSAGMNSTGVYPFETNMVDKDGNTDGWGDSERQFKVWNCQVPVSGTLYDGSAGRVCNNIGFINLIPDSTGFNSITFADISGTNDVPIAVNSPHYGSANLVWGQTYLPLVNGGNVSNPDGTLLAAGRFTRIIDGGVGTTSCPVNSQFNIGDYVSAYGLTPQAQVDLSYIRNQEGWFQVVGAGVKAKDQLASGVPATMTNLARALSISGANSDNGLVSFSNYSNINGYTDDSAYGIPNDWWTSSSTNDSSTFYSYQYFYNKFLVNGGVGVTGTSWSNHPIEGIYFVNGDLNIDNDFSLASGKFFMVVVKGKITIANNVNQLDGIYMSDGGIEALGTVDNQLVINGMLYSRGEIRLGRGYTSKITNNISPAIVVNYNPDLIFNMPGTLMRVLSGWVEQ